MIARLPGERPSCVRLVARNRARGIEMRRVLTAAVIASAILIGGCNTFRGVGRDVRSFKEVVPGGSKQARADTPAPAPAADYVPPATP